MPTQTRTPKMRQVPELVQDRPVIERDLQILSLIERYRFVPTSLLLALIPGEDRSIHERLRVIYHKKLANRFAFRTQNKYGEFNYYLDNRQSLRLLMERGFTKEDLHWSWVRYNREGNYAEAAKTNEAPDTLRFLKHELMVGGFHAAVDWGCRNSKGRIEHTDWRRGKAELRTKVDLPGVISKSTPQGLQWRETEEIETQSLEPDFFFELHYPELPAEQQYGHFLYEAERGRNDAIKYARRLRAYFHFIAKQKKHQTIYNIDRIHGVLTETEDPDWRERLREAACSPVVSEQPSPLFLFTDSSLLTEPRTNPRLPRFVTEPTRIFQQIWYMPAGNEPISLLERY